MRYLFFCLVCVFLLVGCRTVQQAQEDYSYCMGNAECAAEVLHVKEHAYQATNVLCSILAFCVGVIKGRKRGV